MTDPPIIGDLGVLVGKRVGAPVLVISQDVFPEIATELDRLRNPAVIGVLRGLVGAYLRRADRIVAIGETMRERLEAKGAPPERLRVIPNWVDTGAITPQPRDNEWAQRHDLVGRFVVMHSGNVGHAQDLDSLVRSATFLRDRDDLRIVIAGFGARHGEMVALANRLEVEGTVRFLPYQKRARLPLSLSSADVHVVGLAKGLAGYVVPSRLYGILSAGRPVIVAADDSSETARLVLGIGCGVVIPGTPDLLARVIREFADGAYPLDTMGRRESGVRRERGRTASSRWSGIGRSCGKCSRRDREGDVLGVARRARLDACGLSARDGRARARAAAARPQGRSDALRLARRLGARRGGGDPPAHRERARARLPGGAARGRRRVGWLHGPHRRARRRDRR
jgi:glycosyltransferase involved in cell wall biosynthesis